MSNDSTGRAGCPLRRLMIPLLAVLSWLLLALLTGCGPKRDDHAAPPLIAPYPSPRSVVVAPLMNQSPSGDFDPIVATDILVAELSQVRGLTVLPTNRALKVLLARGQTHVRSVEEAIALAQALGTDGVLVGAITDYEPYKPQKVGMTLQFYWVRADMNSAVVDPTALERQDRPEEAAYYAGPGPASQVSAVLDASRDDVTARVERYAAGHRGQDSPYGWRRYLVDSDAYLHFVCHEMIARLLQAELERITVIARAPGD